jgi:uncharacterized membrane protein YbhN (UPF0104 family)
MPNDDGTTDGRAAAADAPPPTTRGRLGLAARWAVSIAGIAYAVHCIHWRDRVEIPVAATASAPAGTVAREVIGRDGSRLRIIEPDGGDGALDLASTPEARVLPGVRTSLAEAEPRLLLLSVLLMAPIYLLQALRWRCLLAAQQARLPLPTLFAFHLAASFLGMFLLGAVGTDLSRTWWLAQRGISGPAAIASVIADRAIGMSTMVATAAILLAIGGGGQDGGATRLWAMTGALAAAALAYYCAPVRRLLGLPWLMARLERFGSLAALRQAAAVYRTSHREVALAALLSLTGFSLLLLGTAACGWAVGMTTPLASLLFSLTLVWFVGSLPISIMGFGVMEPLAIALLARGPTATSGQVMGMLLLARTALLLQVLPGAGVLVWRRSQPATAGASAA